MSHLIEVKPRKGGVCYVDSKHNIYKTYRGHLRLCSYHKSSVQYLEVSINGYREYVHRIVAQAFLPTWDPNLHVNHKDGNKLNNHPSNLEMVTHRENMLHAHSIGLCNNIGSRNGKSRLAEDEVKEIKLMLSDYKNAQIARMFNIDPSVISNIRYGKAWRHI